MPLYGREKWDGIYIVSQIVTIQCWFYFLWIFLHCIIGACFRMSFIPIMDVLFDHKTLFTYRSMIWIEGIELSVVTIAMSVVIAITVERSKKCWDYCATILVIHAIITTYLHSFPYSLIWWLLFGCTASAITAISERICLRRELEEIPVTGL